MIWPALRFTLIEASLSAIFSVIGGVLLARILLRRDIPFKNLLESLLLLPFFLPVLFVVIAVIGIYGQSGMGFSIFGLKGIIIAHMILNIPLVTHLLLTEWRKVPSETLNIARNLDGVFWLIEKPLLKRIIPTALALVFLYCSLSFTIVLTLGGGPKASTLELAIYQAIRYDFNLSAALKIALVQAALGLALYLFLKQRNEAHWPNSAPLPNIEAPKGMIWKIIDASLLIIIAALLLSPLFMLLPRMDNGLVAMIEKIPPALFKEAMFNSLWMAGLVAIGVQLASYIFLRHRIEGLAWLIGAISPVVIAVGFLLLLRQFINPFDYGLALVLFLQGLAMLPLTIRLWQREIAQIAPEEIRLSRSIFRKPFDALRIFWLPRLLPAFVKTLSIAFALAFGDLALLPLLAPPEFINLPMMMWQLISSYRFDAAYGIGFILLLISFLALGIGVFAQKHLEEKHA